MGSYEVTEQILRGYLIFLFGSLLTIAANFSLLVLTLPLLLFPIFYEFYMRLLMVLNIVSVIS